MKQLLLREIKSFFGSAVGYLVIAIFLLFCGLFLWVFDGEYNIMQSGFADLTPFFTIAPWILLFLVPAVCMRGFAEERRQGTLELLLTKPLATREIVGGKFLGAFFLILLAIVPTLIYIIVLYPLGSPEGNLDLGSILGSYFGLMFLVAAYTAIGLFASALTDNQIVAFILGLFLCFVFYYGLSAIPDQPVLNGLGMSGHFESMGRGVIDTRDVVYFLTVTVLFLALTTFKINTLKAGA